MAMAGAPWALGAGTFEMRIGHTEKSGGPARHLNVQWQAEYVC
jgi:hypothetical protein